MSTDPVTPGPASTEPVSTEPTSAGPASANAVPALRVRNLSVAFGAEDPVVRGVSFDVAAGECLAIVGESGSGKSVTARSLLGLAGAAARVTADELALAGESVLGLSEPAWRRRRGRDVGLVLQDALTSLDPLRPIGREIADSLRLHSPHSGPRLSGTERTRRVLEVLDAVGLAHPELYLGRRSGELSGGQRQRALIAAALALNPPLLVADEPTTALDVSVQAQVLDLLEQVRAEGTALVLISHDLAVVSRIADRIAVMHDGQIVESGPTADVLSHPQHPHTRRMLAAVPVDKPRGTPLAPSALPGPAAPIDVRERRAAPQPPAPQDAAPHRSAPLPAAPVLALEARGLGKSFRGPGRLRHTAVDDVSFDLERGTTLGIVGESGSGKTTTARLALALTRADTGEVRLFGEAWSTLPESERRSRRSVIGAVYQDVLASFDPRLNVRDILGHAVDAAAADTGAADTNTADTTAAGAGPAPKRPRTAARLMRERRIGILLDEVGLAAGTLDRRPTDLSGGQRQRVGIARALASRPRVLICDEPVSALDVSVQAQVLDLLDEVQREHALSVLFISHDLGVIQHVSDRVAVMHHGRVVESGPAAQVFHTPENAYTRALLGAVPRLY